MEAENERLRKRLAKAEVKLGRTRAALDIMGKAFAFGAALRERGFAGAVRQVSEETFDLLEPVTGVKGVRAYREVTCHRLPQAQWYPVRVPGAAAGPAECTVGRRA